MKAAWSGQITFACKGARFKGTFSEEAPFQAADATIRLQIWEQDGIGELEVTCETTSPITLVELFLTVPWDPDATDRVFCNGFQSWSESGTYPVDGRIPRLRMPMAHRFNTSGDYTFYPHDGQRGHLYSFTWGYYEAGGKIFGFVDQMPDQGYLILEYRAPGSSLHLREACAGREISQKAKLLQVRTNFTGRAEFPDELWENFRALPAPPRMGWTSWYNHYTKITGEIIRQNLAAFQRHQLPIDLFQIDDGWQPAIGDWTTANAKFPNGMADLATRIQAQGFLAGLWLAPFIVEQKSSIFQEHQDWLLTHDGERLVEAGYNPGWGGLLHGTYYVLDLDLPEVRTHLRQVFTTVLQDWGYDLVKLDFLFAIGLIPRRGRSRGQHMAEAMAFLRECCGDKLILGCGVPLGPAFGQVDYCRIGPDIGLTWEMRAVKAMHLRERISTHSAIRNSIARYLLDGQVFANDPDVFILRQENNKLSPAQKYTLFLVNLIFGQLVLTSDDPDRYDAATLRRYRTAFPLLPRKIQQVRHHGDRYKVAFSIGAQEYLALVNLTRETITENIPPGKYYLGPENWQENPGSIHLGPNESVVLLKLQPEKFSIAGSNLHIFPGSAVTKLGQENGELQLEIHPDNHLNGTVWINLPPAVGHLRSAGRLRNELGMQLLEVKIQTNPGLPQPKRNN